MDTPPSDAPSLESTLRGFTSDKPEQSTKAPATAAAPAAPSVAAAPAAAAAPHPDRQDAGPVAVEQPAPLPAPSVPTAPPNESTAAWHNRLRVARILERMSSRATEHADRETAELSQLAGRLRGMLRFITIGTIVLGVLALALIAAWWALR